MKVLVNVSKAPLIVPIAVAVPAPLLRFFLRSSALSKIAYGIHPLGAKASSLADLSYPLIQPSVFPYSTTSQEGKPEVFNERINFARW